jgi:hypothetical protein
MLKEILSDFYKIIQPSYYTDSFKPYLSMILTIVALTVVIYSFQIFTTAIHAYAQNPLTVHDSVLQTENCTILPKTSLRSFCHRLTYSDKLNYRSVDLLSFEQDLQSSIK